MSSDAIVILKADHKEIRGLFRKFQAAGDNAVKKKETIVGQIITLLTVHTYIENEVMYPEVMALLPDLKEDVLESYEEHHVADVLCMELAGLPGGDERFDAKTTVLIENVTHHVEEEEQDWFPKVRAGLSRKQLQEIGARLEQARKKAPKSPAQPSALKKTIDAVIALSAARATGRSHGPDRARSRNRSGASDARHRTEDAKDEKDSHAAEDECPKHVPRQDRGEDTADRQDGTARPGQRRSSLVGRFEGCITAHRGRRPYPCGRAACHAPLPHPDGQPQDDEAGEHLDDGRGEHRGHLQFTLNNPFPVRDQVQPVFPTSTG
jgi:hemerythrin superfamily protein